MEKEIEEILENFNKLFGMKIEPEITTIDFTIEECKQILDYITNLQQIEQEHKKINGELRKEINKLTAESTEWEERTYCWQDRAENLEIIIDKAVEYIEDMPYLKETDEEFEDIDGNIYHTWKEWTADVLLKILQNGSED